VATAPQHTAGVATACPRCGSVALRGLAESTATTAFFECPSCRRHFARKRGGALTYRWGHPVSLALYGVLFEPAPLTEAPRIAESLRQGRTPEALAAFAEEIELELAHPTQQVGDILGGKASETACRAFLAAVVRQLKDA
jgi:hypothetical protein